MKKIIPIAAAVLILIAVIKIGGPVFTAAIGGDPAAEQQTETTQGADATGTSGITSTESMVTIELSNETEPAETTAPETAEASNEALAEQESQLSAETAAAATTAAREYAVKPIDKTMYAIKPVNVRESYSTDSAIVSSLKAGQEVHATGETENGWIRVDYTGKPAYVAKSFLSTNKADVETTAAAATKPAATQPAPAPSPTQPAATQPSPAPAPTQPAGPTVTQPASPSPGGNNSETIAPFPG